MQLLLFPLVSSLSRVSLLRRLMRRPGIDGGNEQHGFAREGNTGALDGNTGKDRPVAIGREERCQARYSTRAHEYYAFSCYKDNVIRDDMPHEHLAHSPSVLRRTSSLSERCSCCA